MVKKRKIIGDKGIVTLSHHLISFPSLGSGHSSVRLSLDISPTELMRASELILNQVDWSEVVLDVIGKERPAIFRDAFKKILQVRIEELLKQEDKQETENMNEPDIESADDIVDWAGNGLADFEEKISMQRDEENEHGSKGYEDDEDEEDVADEDSEKDDGEEDGEYQEDDDDYEAIADEVSV